MNCKRCSLRDAAFSRPLKKGLSTLRQAQGERKNAMKSGRGSAHAELVEAWGGVFQRAVSQAPRERPYSGGAVLRSCRRRRIVVTVNVMNPYRSRITTQGRNMALSLIHISEPTRLGMISYA